MPKVRVKLLRPLLNREVGSEANYDKADAERLAGYGAVEILGDAPDEDEEKAESPPDENEGASEENKAETAAPARKATRRKATKGK